LALSKLNSYIANFATIVVSKAPFLIDKSSVAAASYKAKQLLPQYLT